MALIVEDGTGVPNADSYVSLSDATAYCAAMGHSAWATASATDQESALRRATQYLDTRYRYAGNRITTTQALEWPRTIRQWPLRSIRDACCELALRALDGELYTDAGDAPVTRETVGPITMEYGYSTNGGQQRYSIVDDMLRGLLASIGRLTLRVERAS